MNSKSLVAGAVASQRKTANKLRSQPTMPKTKVPEKYSQSVRAMRNPTPCVVWWRR